MNILTLGTSFMLGALDGVSPGHGKSLIAAFLIGEKLSWRQIAAMGASLLASHFLLLIVLSAILQFAFAGRQDLAWLEWTGPIMVILFGIYMLVRYRRVSQVASHSLHSEACGCGHHQHGKVDAKDSVKSTREATYFGFLLGLVPCPMAVSTILLSMSTDQFSSALVVIFIYVIGMALVLTGIAVLVYLGRNFLAEKIDRLHHHVDVRLISALMVIGIGVAYLLMNTFHLHIHTA